MDKVARMLILYSSLLNGEEINKTIFCFENECSPRTFDRDIEDIRLFLSESFSLFELEYSRRSNTYYIKGVKKQQLEVMEYLFIEKILQDSPILREDEFSNLKSKLLMNTRDFSKIIKPYNKDYVLYKSPEHNKALLKIHGDLELAIRNQKYIRMVYQDNTGINSMCDIIPCVIRCKSGLLYFTGYIENEKIFFTVELCRVSSFEILRGQTAIEREKVDAYMRSYINNDFSEQHNYLLEVTIECTDNDYKILCHSFDNSEVSYVEDGPLKKIKLHVNEEIFIRWYLIYWTETMTIIEPQCIKDKLLSQAQVILKKYGGRY